MTKHFYIFRHGQCPLNISGHIQGQSINGELTIEGRRQALQTAFKLKPKQISLIITSPLKRAIQTAQIISSELHCPIWVDQRFTEVNMGIIEGMHISTAEKQYAQTYHLWRTSPQGHIRFTNGETKSEVRQRLFSGLRHHATNTPHQNIGISSHGIIISQILFCFGLNQTDIPNGAILHISTHNNNWLYHDLSV